MPLRSLSASQWGVTLVRTITEGIHVGTTLKYVRGTVGVGLGDSTMGRGALLDAGELLDDGMAESRFDLDLGILGVAGPFRIGALVRNVRESEFGSSVHVPGLPDATVRLPGQVRVGVAFDAEAVTSRPLTIAVDVDARSYDTPTGPRRVVAIGAEHWFLAKRLGVRGGGRLNTRRVRERVATAGVSVGIRSGLFLDGHVAGGAGEQGWGLAARVSY